MGSLYFILAIAVILIYFFRKEIKEKIIPKKDKNYTIDDAYNSSKREQEKEIDMLLSKMGSNGKSDLSLKDQKRLDELSSKIK